MASSKQFQVGVIGYGLSAKVFHIPFIQATPQLQLHAIVQRSGDAAKTDHPEATVYRDVDALVADATVDVVVVTTPPPSHFELASKALSAGKHVIVEKPFAPTAAECDTLIALAKKHSVLLTVFQNRRWDADFLTLQKVLASGDLGRIVELESHFDRFSTSAPRASWKALAQPGGGVQYDLGTHLIDQILVLYGLPTRITAFLSSQKTGTPGAVPEDACTILLHYDARDLLVTVKASALSAETKQLRFWARGNRGAFRKCHLDPQEPQILSGMAFSDPSFGVEAASHAGSLTVHKDGAGLVKTTVPTVAPATYVEFYKRLAAALEGKGEVPVTAESSRDVIKLVELAVKSSKEGVTLPVN